METHELVAVGAHPQHRRRLGKGTFPEVLVEEGVPPRRAFRTRAGLEQAEEGAALDRARNVHPRGLEEGGGEVEVDDHLGTPEAPGAAVEPRRHHHQGHPDRRLVHRPLVDQTVLAELKAVVRREHEQGLFQQAPLFQCLDDPAHAVVHAAHRLRVVHGELLEVDRVVVQAVDAVPAPPLRLDPVRLALVVLVPVRHRHGRRIPLPGIAAEMAFRGPERRMHRLVRNVEQERRLLPFSAGQKVQRVVRDQIRGVALPRHAFTVDVEGLVVVQALARERDPAVESGPGGVGRAAHVPLADEGGPVARALEFLREGRRLRIQPRAVVQDAVPVGVLTGEDRGAARRAQRRGHERVLEQHALRDQAVEVRRLEERVAERRRGVETLVVDQDEDDVRPLGGPGRRRDQQRRHASRGQERSDTRCRHPSSLIRRHGQFLIPLAPESVRPRPTAASSSAS